MRSITQALVAASLIALVACGGPPAPAPSPAAPPPTPTPTPSPAPLSQALVVSNPASPASYDMGSTYQLKAVITTQGQPDQDVTNRVQWSTTNPAVATALNNAITIKGLGEVDVLARDDPFAASFHISVKK